LNSLLFDAENQTCPARQEILDASPLFKGAEVEDQIEAPGANLVQDGMKVHGA